MATKAVATVSKKGLQNGIEDMVFERQAMICKAFASSVRLKIIDQVSHRECATSDLQVGLEIPKANLSQHIAVLKSAGVIATRREGKLLYYSLAIPEVKQACQLIRKVLYAQLEGARRLFDVDLGRDFASSNRRGRHG